MINTRSKTFICTGIYFMVNNILALFVTFFLVLFKEDANLPNGNKKRTKECSSPGTTARNGEDHFHRMTSCSEPVCCLTCACSSTGLSMAVMAA